MFDYERVFMCPSLFSPELVCVCVCVSGTQNNFGRDAESNFIIAEVFCLFCFPVRSVSLYVHCRDRLKDYQGRKAQDGHLDFHTAPELSPGTFLII